MGRERGAAYPRPDELRREGCPWAPPGAPIRCTLLALSAVLFLCAILGRPATLAAQDQGQTFAEARLSLFPGASGQQWQMVQRLRPTLQTRLWDRSTLVVTVEARLTQGRDNGCELQRILEESDFAPLLELAGCQWPDRGHRIFRVEEAGDYLEVDRLYLDLYRGAFDLRLGRQSIQWGSAQFFNPTDPFPEVLLTEPWRPRRGVNALRATIPFGTLNDVMAVAALDDGLEHARLASRLRVNARGVNLAVSGAWRGDTRDGQVGLDLRGTNVVGWWAEGALFPGPDPYTELAVGVDYSFPVLERLVVLAQYYRSGSGATRPDDYRRSLARLGAALPRCDVDLGAVLGSQAADASPFARFTLARDYLLAGATSSVTPDLSANAFVLQNLNDGTALWVPTVSFLATDRMDLSLSAQIPFKLWGEGGELKPGAGDLRFEGALPPGTDPLVLDLSGLVPTATLTFWARFSF
jgi:hypothetical protein